MPLLLADTAEVITVTAHSANYSPNVVGLLFGLAGTFFISICLIRRRNHAKEKQVEQKAQAIQSAFPQS